MARKEDIHKHEEFLERKFEALLKEIHPNDRGSVRHFCEDAMVNGVGAARILKYLSSLRVLTRLSMKVVGKKSFWEYTEKDIKRLLLAIERSE